MLKNVASVSISCHLLNDLKESSIFKYYQIYLSKAGITAVMLILSAYVE